MALVNSISKGTVNEPPYKLIDIFQEVVDHINSKLRITGSEVIDKDLGFQYGYYTELVQNLQQANAPGFTYQKYPFLWLVQPITITRDSYDYYGKVKGDLRLFLVQESNKDYKADERETASFDPMLNPVCVQLLKSMKANTKLRIPIATQLNHEVTTRYFWGEDQKVMTPDPTDCIELNFKGEEIIITNNLNCN